MGVLLAANPDPEARPRFSPQAIERAVLWAGLVDRFRTGLNAGYETATLALWCHRDVELSEAVVVPALRSWCENKAELFANDQALLDQKSSAARHERHMHAKLPAEFASRLTEGARNVAAGQTDEQSGVGQIRADLAARTAAYMTSGEDDDDVLATVGEMVGLEDDVVDVVAQLGGVPSFVEMLTTLDDCEQDSDTFARLAEIKTSMVEVLDGRQSVPEDLSPLGLVLGMFRQLDPATAGMVIAVCALSACAVERRGQAEAIPDQVYQERKAVEPH
jgi:hypothetical protein